MSKSFLITGAASGIGAATAEQLAAEQTTLFLHTRANQAGLKALKSKCEDKGANVHLLLADLTLRQDISACIETVKSKNNGLTGLICNAGFPDWRNFEEQTDENFNKSLMSIVNANFSLLAELTPLLKKERHASVITVSSFLAHKYLLGDMVMPASSAAKAALEAMTKSYAAQYAREGITANSICPGYIKKNSPDHTPPSEETLKRITDRIPMARLGMPEEVAKLVAFLVSEDARYITGQCLHIDGGLLLK